MKHVDIKKGFFSLRQIITAGLVLWTAMAYCSNKENKQLYNTLDSLLEKQQEITKEKENRINFIHDALKRPGVKDESRYQIYLRLFDEYLAFSFDSAYNCIQECIKIQQKVNDFQQLSYCNLRLSHILSVTGLFNKTAELLGQIEPEKLNLSNLTEYYNAKQEFYLFESEQAKQTPYFQAYLDSAIHYRELILSMKSLDKYTEIFTKATYQCEKGDVNEAIQLIERYLPEEKEARRYSILTSTLAYFYERKGNTNMQEYYLILSAISDVRNAIRENNSLRELSALLMKKRNTDRAFKYLKASIEDAIFYGTRLRNMQNASLSPEIINSYNNVRDRNHQITWILLLAISAIAITLFISRLFRSKLIMKLKDANQKNEDINNELRGANQLLSELNKELNLANGKLAQLGRVKEEYIGHLFELGSLFIKKETERSNKLNRLIRNHKMEELSKEIRNTEYLNNLSDIYLKRFDEAFLNICPNFVEEVNKLFTSENQFIIKKGILTTELRILALFRLGIDNNQKIAEILNSSITTIYTYRSKIKAKAINKATFEQDIMMIQDESRL